MSASGGHRLFVGTVTRKSDVSLMERESWYRVPVSTIREDAPWPPRWFAPWETLGASGSGVQQIRSVWEVGDVRVVTREELFPGEAPGAKSGKRYYRLDLGDPEALPVPILTGRRRRSLFIHSDVRLLDSAKSINDLFANGPLEDEFWSALKQRGIPAERQWPSYGESGNAMFDFAVFCMNEDIDIEVDGDQHHTVPEISRDDSRRDNATQLRGYRTLRFDSTRVRHGMARCMAEVEEMVERCGGIAYDAGIAAKVDSGLLRSAQPPLFDVMKELR